MVIDKMVLGIGPPLVWAGVPEYQVSTRVAGLIEDFGPDVFISCDDLAGLMMMT